MMRRAGGGGVAGSRSLAAATATAIRAPELRVTGSDGLRIVVGTAESGIALAVSAAGPGGPAGYRHTRAVAAV